MVTWGVTRLVCALIDWRSRVGYVAFSRERRWRLADVDGDIAVLGKAVGKAVAFGCGFLRSAVEQEFTAAGENRVAAWEIEVVHQRHAQACQRGAVFPAPRLRPVRERPPEWLIHSERQTRRILHEPPGAALTGADLTGAILQPVFMPGAILNRRNLVGANLAGARLTGADLADADLRDADLHYATLNGASLARAILTGADLHYASLRGGLLPGMDLTGADLTGANLPDANLTGADLTDANLADAALTNTNLTGVFWSTLTIWPHGLAELMRARSEERQPGRWQVIGPGNAGLEPKSRCLVPNNVVVPGHRHGMPPPVMASRCYAIVCGPTSSPPGPPVPSAARRSAPPRPRRSPSATTPAAATARRKTGAADTTRRHREDSAARHQPP
jgi:uncharacterized protein YjbI with pentapeptide repeats